MHKVKVGVLRGGPSREYEVSLNTGNNVLRNLDEEKYISYDVFINRDGVWHVNGKEVLPENVINMVDVIFNALHGSYGEDGTVQRLLDKFAIPYTGSRTFSSAISMNKELTKHALKKRNIKMPRHMIMDFSKDWEEKVFEIFRSFPQPTVIKPILGGSSVGITFGKSYGDLMDGIEYAFKYSPRIMIEEYINGREATCGVVDGYRGDEFYTMPPVEIVPSKESSFFDYEAKYGGKSQEICPGNFPLEIKEGLQSTARKVHEALGLNHYSRSDFIVSPRGIYFLEVNTLPGLTEESLLPKSLDAVGFKFPDFLDHLITLAVDRK